VSQGIVSEKFQIDNGSNRIDINLDDGSDNYSMHSIFDSPREDEDIDNISVEPGEEPPRKVRNFIEQKTNIKDVSTEGKMIDIDIVYKDGRRWYSQYVFEEGDDIYIRGIYERDGFNEKVRNSNEDTYVIGCSKADYIKGLGKYIHWTFVPLVTSSVIVILLLFSPDIAILICKILTVLSFPALLYWLFDSLK
jgi:hypothetical protein